MTINSILHTGIQGIQHGMASADQAAKDIVRAGQGMSDSDGAILDVTESMVDLLVSEQQVKASAAVVSTGSDILGTLIDTIA